MSRSDFSLFEPSVSFDKVACEDRRGRSWTYEVVLRRVAQLKGFLEEQGIGSGNRVMVHVPASRKLLTDVLGVLSAGASCVLIDDQEPALRVREIAQQCRAAGAITDALRADRFEAQGEEEAVTPLLLVHTPQGLPKQKSAMARVSFGEINRREVEVRRVAPTFRAEAECFSFLPTASTAGEGLSWSWQQMSARMASLQAVFPLQPDDRTLVLSSLSLWHAVQELLLSMALGATIILGDEPLGSVPSRLSEFLRERKVTRLVERQDLLQPWFRSLNSATETFTHLSQWSIIRQPPDPWRGADVPPVLAKSQCGSFFGQIDTGFCVGTVGSKALSRLGLGQALPGYELCLDGDGAPEKEGGRGNGELLVSPTLGGADVSDSRAEPRSWARTGQLVKMEQGYFTTVGRRRDRCWWSHGRLVNPAFLEARLMRHPQVRVARVFQVDEHREVVVEGDATLTKVDLHRFLVAELPPWLRAIEIKINPQKRPLEFE